MKYMTCRPFRQILRGIKKIIKELKVLYSRIVEYIIVVDGVSSAMLRRLKKEAPILIVAGKNKPSFSITRPLRALSAWLTFRSSFKKTFLSRFLVM